MAKPKGNFGKIQQIVDGQVHRYHKRRDGRVVVYTICCDCSLVHLEEIIPKDKYLRVRVWRDDEKTAQLRKRKRRK